MGRWKVIIKRVERAAARARARECMVGAQRGGVWFGKGRHRAEKTTGAVVRRSRAGHRRVPACRAKGEPGTGRTSIAFLPSMFAAPLGRRIPPPMAWARLFVRPPLRSFGTFAPPHLTILLHESPEVCLQRSKPREQATREQRGGLPPPARRAAAPALRARPRHGLPRRASSLPTCTTDAPGLAPAPSLTHARARLRDLQKRAHRRHRR